MTNSTNMSFNKTLDPAYAQKMKEVKEAVLRKAISINDKLYGRVQYFDDASPLIASGDYYGLTRSFNNLGYDATIIYDTKKAIADINEPKRDLMVIFSCHDDLVANRYPLYLKEPAKTIELLDKLPINLIGFINPNLNDGVKFDDLVPVVFKYNTSFEKYNQFDYINLGSGNNLRKYNKYNEYVPTINLTCQEMIDLWQQIKHGGYIKYHFGYYICGDINKIALTINSIYDRVMQNFRNLNDIVADYAMTHIKMQLKDNNLMHFLVKKNTAQWCKILVQTLNKQTNYFNFIETNINSVETDGFDDPIDQAESNFVFCSLKLLSSSKSNYSNALQYLDFNDLKTNPNWLKRLNSLQFLTYNGEARYYMQSLPLPHFTSISQTKEIAATNLLNEIDNSQISSYLDVNPDATKTLPEIFNMITYCNPRQTVFIENHTLVALLGDDTIREIDSNQLDQQEKPSLISTIHLTSPHLFLLS